MSEIRLTEHGPPVVVQLSDQEAHCLSTGTAELRVVPTRSAGHYEVSATYHVGTIVLPQRVVRIAPKVPIARLMHLLGFAPELMHYRGVAEHARDADVVGVMKHVYSVALGHAMERGLVNEYRVAEDELVGVRGRVDEKDLFLRRFGVFPPIRCEFQEYGPDCEVNRRLRAAASLLARSGAPSESATRRLRASLQRLDEVEAVRYDTSRLQPLRRHRLLDRVEPALSIAESILGNASLELRGGQTPALALTFDMNRVYERYVARALRSHLGLSTRAWCEQPRALYVDEAKSVPMTPDIVWYGDDLRPQLVIDSKYKSVKNAPADDIYQMVAYCTALGLKDGVLVYPEVEPAVHRVRGSAIRVHQALLAIDGDLGSLQAAVGALADQVTQLGFQAAPREAEVREARARVQ